ncbi:hypothetical protein [Streptomyces sp. KN37]|uniref:hypothetical protein n=1 Tax=Streptomyces sp. KN37 TaxID=3090667 RepID=UPI002A74BF62|nr:hypothetical protein [Streptomyces sp. KN37]WPO76030.1 hypothetical protein R9806_27665 [Streptomyces sp. KN37]
MIKPAGIPRFIGDWEQLAKDVSGLRSDAIGIRNGGADVHSRFQMLGAYYTAPEADDLFATTQPVMDEADTFAAHLETVADALDTFAAEARPLAEKLTSLREDAFKFVESVEGDDDWTDDGDKVERNNELWADVIAAKSAFEAAERRAAGKISAIVGGPKYIEDDGSHRATEQTVMYGYDADVLKQAEELPWGSPVSETTAPGDFKGHLKNFLYDGFAVDGAGATLKGLGALVGIGGSAKEAWGHLGDAAMGTGYYLVTPLDWVMDQTMFADEDTETMKRQKAAAREFGKAMVAWDQWEEHPVQAAGTTTFNVLTLGAGPLGALARGGSVAGKAGLGAKAAGIGAKIGTYADPLSAGLTVGGKVVSKLPTVAEVTSRIRAGAGATANIERVHSTLEFEGTRVRVEDGEFIRLDTEGNPVRGAAPHEKSADERAVSEQAPPQREPALVGAGTRAPGASAHAGEHLSPQASHEPPAGKGAADSPRGSGHNDVAGSAGSRSNDTLGPSGSHGHGTPGDTGRVPSGRSGDGATNGLDALHQARDNATARPDGDVPGRSRRGERPSFMRDGPNPYGPRGSLTPEQIEEIQVYRANHEPGYFEDYYKNNGNRKRLSSKDQSGFRPPQLTRADENSPWIRAKDAPDPPSPHFLDDDYIPLGEDALTSASRRSTLHKAAEARHYAVQWDNLMERLKNETGEYHKAQGTIDSAALWGEAKGAYKESHTQMGYLTEEFGEAAARHHYIAEHYPGFKDETLLGPKNGNDQFDQVWTGKDGRVVVVEAKSSPDTRLGKRNLPGGRQVSQGSKEYFDDILRLMKKRGEVEVVAAIEKAIAEGKLEYVVVKGGRNAGAYTGLLYRRFDISKGTL